MFAGTSDGRLLIWNRKQTVLQEHLMNYKQITSLDFASEQQNLAVGTSDGKVQNIILISK